MISALLDAAVFAILWVTGVMCWLLWVDRQEREPRSIQQLRDQRGSERSIYKIGRSRR